MRVIGLAALVWFAATPVEAQQRDTFPVTIAMAERPAHPQAMAMVLHEPSRRRDVIVLPANASPIVLIAALSTYRRLRNRPEDTRVGIHSIRGLTPSADRVEWAAQLLAELRRKTPEDVDGVGQVRQKVIWLR